jgi:hypothetical protein
MPIDAAVIGLVDDATVKGKALTLNNLA